MCELYRMLIYCFCDSRTSVHEMISPSRSVCRLLITTKVLQTLEIHWLVVFCDVIFLLFLLGDPKKDGGHENWVKIALGDERQIRFKFSKITLYTKFKMATETETTSKFTDKELTCKDCNKPWTFSAGEQEFYAEKAFENEPARCKECRKIQKDARRKANLERRKKNRRTKTEDGDAAAPKAKGNCYAFAKGECERGDACRYSHVVA